MLPPDAISNLLANWDLDPVVSIEAFDTAAHRFSPGKVVFITTRSQKYVLKRLDHQPASETGVSLLAVLHAQGIPVSVPSRTRAGPYWIQHGEECYSLSPYLPGQVISDHYSQGAEQRVRRFGIALAQLHQGLKHCEHLGISSEMNLLRDVEAGSQMLRARTGTHLPMLSELTAGLTKITPRLPVQLIHRDAHAANLLFVGEQVSGWLDFELIMKGPRIFDLCYAATSILMDALNNPARQVRWLAVLEELVRGYSSVNPLTAAERSAVWLVLLSIEVIFAAYFSRLQDEKGITQNLTALHWLYQHRPQIQVCVSTQDPSDRAAV